MVEIRLVFYLVVVVGGYLSFTFHERTAFLSVKYYIVGILYHCVEKDLLYKEEGATVELTCY